jgi:hypothetical protein
MLNLDCTCTAAIVVAARAEGRLNTTLYPVFAYLTYSPPYLLMVITAGFKVLTLLWLSVSAFTVTVTVSGVAHIECPHPYRVAYTPILLERVTSNGHVGFGTSVAPRSRGRNGKGSSFYSYFIHAMSRPNRYFGTSMEILNGLMGRQHYKNGRLAHFFFSPAKLRPVTEVPGIQSSKTRCISCQQSCWASSPS